MGEEGNEKYPSWKLILMLVLTITAWLIKEGVSSQFVRIEKMEKAIEMKVDQADHQKDIAAIKESIQDMKTCMSQQTKALNNMATAIIVHDKAAARYLKNGRGE